VDTDSSLSLPLLTVGEDRIKEVKAVYAELEKIASDKSKDAAAKTEAVTKIVEEKLGASSHFASLGLGAVAGKAGDLASQGKKYLEGLGLGDFTKVRPLSSPLSPLSPCTDGSLSVLPTHRSSRASTSPP
jgi:hypothetical protein